MAGTFLTLLFLCYSGLTAFSLSGSSWPEDTIGFYVQVLRKKERKKEPQENRKKKVMISLSARREKFVKLDFLGRM